MATQHLPKNNALSSEVAVKAVSSVMSVYLGLQKQFYQQADKKGMNVSAPTHSLNAKQFGYTVAAEKAAAQSAVLNPSLAKGVAPSQQAFPQEKQHIQIQYVAKQAKTLAETQQKDQRLGNTEVFNPKPQR